MEELKKCPFCGGEAVLEECEYGGYSEYLVYCNECSGMVEKWRKTKEEAIEQWNRRAEK